MADEKAPLPNPADEIEKIAAGGTTETDEEKQKAAKVRKKRLLMVIIIAVILLGGGGAAAFMLLGKKKEDKKEVEKAAVAVHTSIYIDLEDFIVNLSASASQPRFLKLVVSVEVGSEPDKNQVIANMPKVRDAFQVYLRELKPEDLQGSQSLFRLREELLFRLNKLLYPVVVKDIFFNEVIVQ
ncbi:MAG: flagellar basal body-associated FliL family protein [Alphaproteobacteria bacterium]|nr:flagellar basal body-associated FliL family protein [Alphaproteobacteria bacterium]